MTTVNHALWGATLGRLIGLPIQGAILASAPDVLSIPILSAYYFQGRKKSNQVPQWAYNWYSFLHNWLLAGILIAGFSFIHLQWWILGVAYFFHVFEDGLFHTDYATRFLFPLWKGKIQLYSASEHKWIQFVDLGFMLFINLLISKYKITF